jgi:pantetheine-phosphate adenylyltransferase
MPQSPGEPGFSADCVSSGSSIKSANPAFPRRGAVKKNVAIYPGSFDPPTNGHLDLIERGSHIFDELVVAILRNPGKEALFTLGERRKMLQSLTSRWDNVRVDTFDGLLVEYARKQKADAVLRGIRAISDYEYELQMALMNRKLDPKLETVFMMPAEAYSYLSSRLVKEIVTLGGSISGLVPSVVEEQLRERVKHNPHHLQRPENIEGMNGERKERHGNHRRDGVQEAGRAMGAASHRKGRA